MIIACISKGISFGIRNPAATFSSFLIEKISEFSQSDVTSFNKLLNQIFNQLNYFATEFRKQINDLFKHFYYQNENNENNHEVFFLIYFLFIYLFIYLFSLIIIVIIYYFI